jgi:ribosomal protein S27E
MKHWFSGVCCETCGEFVPFDDLGLDDGGPPPPFPEPESDLLRLDCSKCGHSSSWWSTDKRLKSMPPEDRIGLRSGMKRKENE